MANWCDLAVTVEGDNAERALTINERLQSFGEDSAASVLVARDRDEKGRESGMLTDGFAVKDGKTQLRGVAKWGIPVLLLEELSKEFSDLTFKVDYSVEGCWDAATVEFHNGEIEETARSCGWFRTVKGDEPIHHFVVRPVSGQDDKLKELADNGTVFHTETARPDFNEWATFTPPDQLGLELEYDYAYTLDEATYLWSCVNRVVYIAFAPCYCFISLTQQERDYLAQQDDPDDFLRIGRQLRLCAAIYPTHWTRGDLATLRLRIRKKAKA